MKTKLSLFFILIYCFKGISAQEGYIIKHDSLKSDILKQDRRLNIYLPEGYDTAKTRFPVIYVLDGDWRDQHIVPTVRFLNQNEKMPLAIIVGVLNKNREHDFLPDSTKGAPTGGGAKNFLRFFSDELIPYIENNYKSETYRVLIGHSYGGLFTMFAMLEKPELFNAYIAMDPSFWYKNKMLLKQASEEFMKQMDWNRPLFISGRQGSGMDEMGISDMEKLLKNSAPKDLRWKVVPYPFEDHGSVVFKSVYDGLRYIFDSGGELKVYPQSGIIPGKRSFTAYVSATNPDIRFTTDGSEPDLSSPLADSKMVLKGSCILKLKDVSKKYKSWPAVTYIFKKGRYLGSLKAPENLKSGLKYSYYEGAWDSLPDFSKLTPLKTGITDSINLNMAAKKDSFALRFEGYIKIKDKDLYDIWIMSDEDSELFINNNVILSNTGNHPSGLPKVAVVPLKPGYYPVIITYFEKNGRESLSCGMIRGKEDPNPAQFGRELLFHEE